MDYDEQRAIGCESGRPFAMRLARTQACRDAIVGKEGVVTFLVGQPCRQSVWVPGTDGTSSEKTPKRSMGFDRGCSQSQRADDKGMNEYR